MEKQEQEDVPGLHNLPTEVILLLFEYLDFEDILRFSVICKRFYAIFKDDNVWGMRSNKALVTNLQDPKMRQRSLKKISNRERVRISYNWKCGKYSQLIKFDFKGIRYMPWLCLIDNCLWLSRGNTIYAYKKRRNKFGQMDLRLPPHKTLRGHMDDVCRFIYCDGIIVSGGRDCSICGFSASTGNLLFKERWAHNSEVSAVDFRDQIVVSGCSKDAFIKVWRLSSNGELSLQKQLGRESSKDWTLSLALRPFSDDCLVGSSGHNNKPIALYNFVCDCEVGVFNQKFMKGSGIKDIIWETPHTVLTTGYDTYVRLWDCRTGKMECSWGDVFDSAVYCMATDKMYTIITGTNSHNRVQLWDKRQAHSVQGYFFHSPYKLNSSVYGVAFDAHSLYAGFDTCVSILDFSGHKNKSRNLFAGWT